MVYLDTIDTRPHVVGDLIIFTGTYNCASVDTGTTDLSDLCSEILSVTLNNDTDGDATGGGVDGGPDYLQSTRQPNCGSGPANHP